MKTVSAVWFLNLAIAHFIFCANLPFQIMSIARGWTWPFGKLFTIKRHNKSQWPFRVITPLVVSFFACWFPYHVFALIKLEVTFSLKWLLYDILRSVSVCLAYFNSCLNPILYVFIGKDVNYKVKKPILSILENAFSERFILRSKEIDHTTDTYV
ncbi:N-formyl peptide receptor 2-like [Discoglossus pictus]